MSATAEPPPVQSTLDLRGVPRDGDLLGSRAFRLFRLHDGGSVRVVWLWYPETKGVSLEALEKRLETR